MGIAANALGFLLAVAGAGGDASMLGKAMHPPPSPDAPVPPSPPPSFPPPPSIPHLILGSLRYTL